jgi:hypothetical protein
MSTSIKQVLALLTMLGPVHGYRYHSYNIIRREVDKLKTPMLMAQWEGSDSWKNKKPENWRPPEMIKESTYEDCVQWIASAQDNIVVMTVTVWQGDSFKGYPTYKRASWAFEVTDAHTGILYDVLWHAVSAELNARAIRDEKRAREEEFQKAVDTRVKEYLRTAGALPPEPTS